MEEILIPTNILDAAYLILCSVSDGFQEYEVYDEAKPAMSKALKWIIEYGTEKNLDTHGLNYKK